MPGRKTRDRIARGPCVLHSPNVKAAHLLEVLLTAGGPTALSSMGGETIKGMRADEPPMHVTTAHATQCFPLIPRPTSLEGQNLPESGGKEVHVFRGKWLRVHSINLKFFVSPSHTLRTSLRHFRHWRRLAACGGLGWTARRDLCHAAFSRWLQWYLDTPAVEASFAWADFVDDDI